MDEEHALDAATVSVLAHGLLNNLSAVGLAMEVVLRTHPDVDVVSRMGSLLDGQFDAMRDSLQLLLRGLPADVMALLAEPSPPPD